MNAPQQAGWFGKLPALGDFAQRRLDTDFVNAWDVWLQGVIPESQRALGTAWLSRYLTAPVWRFVLSRGIAGPQTWAGIILPSVDRVGRYFPLTVCAPLGTPRWSDPDMQILDAWMDRLEDAARACLSHDATVDGFESDLAQAGLPQFSAPAGQGAEAVAALLTRSAALGLPGMPGQPPALDEVARSLFDSLITGYTLWWCKDGSRARAFAHLPTGSAYVTMLDATPAT